MDNPLVVDCNPITCFATSMIHILRASIRARVEPWHQAVPVAFRSGGFDLSFVETFDGRDRHVLASLLVFLRSFFYIYKSVNWISASAYGGGSAIGPYLVLVGVFVWI